MIKPWQLAASGFAGVVAFVPVDLLIRPPAWLGFALGMAAFFVGQVIGIEILAKPRGQRWGREG